MAGVYAPIIAKPLVPKKERYRARFLDKKSPIFLVSAVGSQSNAPLPVAGGERHFAEI